MDNPKNFKVLNPWKIPQDEDFVMHIQVSCHATLHGGHQVDYDAIVLLPSYMVSTGDLEGAATLAFQEARKDGLEAPLMAFCYFAFYAHEEETWYLFDPADGGSVIDFSDDDEE